MNDKTPDAWWVPGPRGGIYVRSLHGGFKRVASNATGRSWSSDGVDGNPEQLPDGARPMRASSTYEILVEGQREPVRGPFDTWSYNGDHEPVTVPHPDFPRAGHQAHVTPRRTPGTAENGYQPDITWSWACPCGAGDDDIDTEQQARDAVRDHLLAARGPV